MGFGRKSSIKVGDKYGMITVLSPAGKTTGLNPKRSLWLCRCDCGNEKLFDAGNLKKPTIKSCGCLKAQRARDLGKSRRSTDTYINDLYGNLKRSSKRRGFICTLSKEEFISIILKPCFYCGVKPTNKDISKVGLPIPKNGIDRVDNKKGYILDNCCSCCTTCNLAKGTKTLEEFKNWIKQLINFQTNKE